MYIFSQDKQIIMNTETANTIKTSTDNMAILGIIGEGKPYVLGRYESTEAVFGVLGNMIKHLTKGTQVFEMPAAASAEASYNSIPPDVPWHHATGKKTKGHGGS